MNRLRALVLLAASLALPGCPPREGPHLAHLKVQCLPAGAESGGQIIDESSVPPEHGQSCPAGNQVSFTFDNQGGYGFVTVFAVTRDDVVFFYPSSKEAESIPIQNNGTNIPLPDRFTVPPKTRDIMALFTKDPLRAKDVEKNTREVTLASLPGTEVRVRLSAEVGPID